jgi:HEAT repeat protein/beta-lactamase regulating signal transducer with metallopeptidase domain
MSELVAGFLLNATWQIAAIALFAWMCSRFLRSAAARYRHSLWVASLVLSLALPLWSLLDLTNERPHSITEQRAGAVAAQGISNATPNSTSSPEMAPAEDGSVSLGKLLQKRRQPVITALSLSLILAICYALFLLYRLGALWLSWRQTQSLRRSVYKREIPVRMSAVAARCRDALGLRDVTLVCSAKVAAPVTIGALDPLIILPEMFYTTLSEETLVSVLGHEMAHIARHDYALNLLYECLCLPISFHPLARLIKRQIDRTRELACDDLVTERLLEPKAYARALLRVAGSLVAPSDQAFTLGIFDADILEERIMKLTQKTRRPAKRACRLLALTALSLLCLSSLTISIFSFDLRIEEGRGVSIAAVNDVTGALNYEASHQAATTLKNQSAARPQSNISPQESGSNGAQSRAQEACEALKRRSPEAIPTLVSMLGDDRPTQLLRCWEGSRWSPALDTFKQASPGEQAAIALASLGTPAVEPLTNALDDANPSVRRNAAWAIGELTNMRGDERVNAVPPLISLLNDGDEWVRMAAVRALGEIRDERAVEKLIAALSDDGWKVRELAAWALGEMKEERAVQPLGKLLLEDARAEVRETAAWALGEISDPRALPFLKQALNDTEKRVQEKVRWALSEIEDSDG